MDLDALTQRILYISYKLDHYQFQSTVDKTNLLKELYDLIEQRNKILKSTAENK